MNETIIKKRALRTDFHEEEDGTAVMNFEGWFDTTASIQATRDMEKLQNLLDRNIVLDLTGLKYISSSGLRLFLSLLKDTRAHGGSVSITGASEYIRSVFEQTGFDNFFKIQ